MGEKNGIVAPFLAAASDSVPFLLNSFSLGLTKAGQEWTMMGTPELPSIHGFREEQFPRTSVQWT
jgi:hypothetical protein